jgi:transposase
LADGEKCDRKQRMNFEEQAATLDRKTIVELLASHQRLADSVDTLKARNAELMRQLDWFKRQLFDTKSERRFVDPDSRQLSLGEWKQEDAPASEITVAEHHRRSRKQPEKKAEEEILRFDDSVPVEEIRLSHPALDADHEIISEKTTYRLAQKPASYVLLKYIRPVIKRKDNGQIVCPPAPAAVLGKSLADVSLLACMAIDKFRYHLPLYRQHQRMAATGIRLARSTLTGMVHRTADLLEPIYQAQLCSVISGSVVAMDETPIKAGRKHRGKMKTGYFWPVYGDRDEIVFPFSDSRSGAFIQEILGEYDGVLLTDGYSAYDSYATRVNGVVHAQCWSHTRRQFLKAENIEPELTATALDHIRDLYEAEDQIGTRQLDEAKRLEQRAKLCKPIVDKFFEWVKDTLDNRILLPSNPFTEATGYALAREGPLRVFLEYPDVPIDTNHVEREIRPIALGRKNWLFCWTEVGAQCVGILQSLIATCRLQGVDPYTYLVDVLQRVECHPASDVAALTPRLWKERFAADPMRSVIDRPVNNAVS